MTELNDDQFQTATERGAIDLATKPRARSVSYDRHNKRIVIDLVNGATFSFPARLAQGLEHASEEEIAHIEILGAGFGLHWPKLDADLTVEGLLAGRFGTPRYMATRFGEGWDVEAAE
jgi:predicted TPR repeat methyltransferase